MNNSLIILFFTTICLVTSNGYAAETRSKALQAKITIEQASKIRNELEARIRRENKGKLCDNFVEIFYQKLIDEKFPQLTALNYAFKITGNN